LPFLKNWSHILSMPNANMPGESSPINALS
jgi:hypothetical protein